MKRLASCALLIAAGAVFGAEVDVVVLDRDGRAVPDVVVSVSGTGLSPDESLDTAVMQQVNEAFSPHIVAVRSGQSVAFPNNDPIAHHVYSFSRPNDFTLPLSKDRNPAPVAFESEGVVVVGCNIHDHMLGYILVLEAPRFAITDDAGQARLDVSGASEDLIFEIWSPRIRDGRPVTTQQITASDSDGVVFKLQKKLRPEARQESWSDY
ncbi:MAG: methylamine utilization protein [Pseudomonadota bacterium]